jgi:hypothetical protein
MGAGLMGTGIAQVVAMGGYKISIRDISGVDVVYHSLEGLTKVYGDRFKPIQTHYKRRL